MHDFLGFVLEKVGRSVNKVMLLRNVGQSEIEKEVEQADGSFQKQKVKVIKRRVVAAHYFSSKEHFWLLKTRVDGIRVHKAYELKLEHEIYGRGEVHVQFLDFDTGDALNMDGQMVIANERPEYLARLVDTKHIVDFLHQHKQEIQWIFLVVGGVLGGVIGFLVGKVF